MSQLLDQLRRSQVIAAAALDSALRRQQIYGGSLDTVLLELGLIDAPALAKQIAAANHCENAPVGLIDPGPERPWDALPPALLELGWAMPLRRHGGRVQIVVHPEIPPEQRAALEQSVAQIQVFSTCEACLAKLAAERRGSVMPQRYAVLALEWKQALLRAEPAPAERPTEPGTEPMIAPLVALIGPPMLVTPAMTERYSVPSPEAVSKVQPVPAAGQVPPSKPRATLIYNLAAVSLDDDPRPTRQAPDSKPASAPVQTAPAQLPRAASSPTAPTLRERLVEPRRALEQATGRDQATDALVRAAMQISPRAALFGVKREGLRGLAGPGTIPDLAAQLVELSPAIEAAIDGRTPLDRAADLDLRIAVSQEMAVPCVFLPIKVQDRPVLMLYVDRDGAEFSVDEVAAAKELCTLAGRTLEEVLRRMRSDKAQAPAAPAPAQASKPIVPVVPVSAPKPIVPASAPAPVPPTPAPRSVPSAAKSGSFLGTFKPPPTLAPPPTLGPSAIKPAKPPNTPSVAVPSIAAPAPSSRPVPPIVQSRPTSQPAPPIVQSQPIVVPRPIVAPPLSTSRPGAVPPSQPLPPAQPIPLSQPLPTAPIPAASAKPPVRLRRAEPEAGQAPPTDATRPGLTALSTPLGDAGSVRGRIVIDDEEDRQRARVDVNAEAIDSAIVAAMRGGSSSIHHLRAFGDAAYRRIAKQFPGELDVHRRDLDTLPPLPAHGALIRVALELPELGPYLLELIDHPNPTVRFYVAFVFMELRHSRAVGALGELAFDPDADVRAISMRVLETYSGEIGFAEAVAVIRRELDSPNRTRQLHATRAVGTVRDIIAVPKLIDQLTHKERFIQESALESLCSITGQQLGLKPHRWRSWYADNAHHHRVEWIISSLAHKDLSVRRWAADELKRITGQRINFLAAGSKQEREIGIRKWIEWWTERGRAEFSS